MKNTIPSSDPLPNARHEAFAREVASGKNATQAYTAVYAVENPRVASTGGHRLMRRKSVAARIKAIQQAGAAGVALDLREIHEFLTRVVRTPAGQVVPSSDLCTRVKHTRDGTADVWMPDKIACIRLSAKLQGFLDTASPARTARLAQTTGVPASPAQFDPTKQPITADTDVRIMTEERRAILMAKKRAVTLRRLKQAEEERQAQEASKAAVSGESLGSKITGGANQQSEPIPRSHGIQPSSPLPNPPRPTSASTQRGPQDARRPAQHPKPFQCSALARGPWYVPGPAKRAETPSAAKVRPSGAQPPSAFTRVTSESSSQIVII